MSKKTEESLSARDLQSGCLLSNFSQPLPGSKVGVGCHALYMANWSFIDWSY